MDRLNQAADAAANYAKQAGDMANKAAQTASRFGNNQQPGQNQNSGQSQQPGQNSGQNQQWDQNQQSQMQQGQMQHGQNCPSKQGLACNGQQSGCQ
ncbi:hypothetical protein CPC16_004760 [Podila verticillata]|nr:hypothetical protein CPC16_004760 [Podila verticillata]